MKLNVMALAKGFIVTVLLAGTILPPASAARRDKTTTSASESVADSSTLAGQRSDYEAGKALETFIRIYQEVNRHYVDTTDPAGMIKNAANAMLRRLDPYTEYLSEDRMDDFQTMTTGKYAGVGALIQQSGDWVMVSKPYEGSPSDLAGLKAGDRILEIDGISTKGQTVSQVSDRLRGRAGTTVSVTIRPIQDTNSVKSINITRDRITVPAVPYYGWLNDSTGYIRLESFTENCAADVRKALNELQSTGRLQGLVFDLRDNTGGILGEAVKIAGFFLPRGTEVVSIRGRNDRNNHTYRTFAEPIAPQVPLAVLINSSSASASEIVAGALQDLDRAVIIGQRSFGKGLVQSTRPVGEKEIIKLTTAKYYTPSGRCIQAVDYSHRNEDGSVGNIPDSLMNSFRTSNSRTVYDGGGIMPDIDIPNEYLSKFTAILIAKGYIDEFANIYAAGQYGSVAWEDRFYDYTISDETYARFREFLVDKPLDFESGTERKLKELRQMAEREKYEERITEQLNAIADKLRDDREAELDNFSDEIRRELAAEIIGRWFYNAGQIKYLLRTDPVAHRAAEILADPSEYTRILTLQDTEKK